MKCPLCGKDSPQEYALMCRISLFGEYRQCCSYRICFECVSKLYTGKCPQCRTSVTLARCLHEIEIKKRTDYLRTQPVRSVKKKKLIQ